MILLSQEGALSMRSVLRLFHHLVQLVYILLAFLGDTMRFLLLCLRPPAALVAENLFLRKQLALYQERHIKPRRATDATRLALVWLGRWFDWRQALAIVQPETFTRWHQRGFRLFWRSKSGPGRPPIPTDLQALIRRMARENPSWGEERLANELLLKLGLRVSPRTIRKYLPKRLNPGRGKHAPTQRWQTFVRNHAQAIVACDFCVVVTATFRLLYVFVIMEHATRRILHCNVTAHPTAPWMLQQLRILTQWVPHYNAGRSHMSLGPGIPQPPPHLLGPLPVHRHRLPGHLRVVTRPILGGLHHEYQLEKVAYQ